LNEKLFQELIIVELNENFFETTVIARIEIFANNVEIEQDSFDLAYIISHSQKKAPKIGEIFTASNCRVEVTLPT